MKDFAELIGGTAGVPKTREEIAATTLGKPKNKRNWQPPNGYEYGKKLQQWDSSLPVGAEDLLARCEPRNDRMLVRLIDDAPKTAIHLTDAKPLIGGCRKAIVMKVGPGRWIPGEWWKTSRPLCLSMDDAETGEEIIVPIIGTGWEWVPGYRRPVSVNPGQTVLIGNWVDLEANGLALCMEGDIRATWAT